METYFTKVNVQADRWVAETEETTEEEFNKRREGLLDGDCSCRG